MGQGRQVLFNTGMPGPQVNNFALEIDGEGRLNFAVQSQRYTRVAVEGGEVAPGAWREVAVAWGGFNRIETVGCLQR